MKRKKIWAIFSGLGFALLGTSLIEAIRAGPDFSNPLNFVGLMISVMGLVIILNSVLWLSTKRDGSLLKIEGVYKVARHPMYLGGIIFAIGLGFVLMPSFLFQTILLGLSVICFFMASRLEDNFNVEKFGEDYKKYISKVPALGFSNRNQRLVVFLLIIIVGSISGMVGYSNVKIKTFEECEKAGWLVRSIKTYDSVGGYGSVERECILWSGRHFTKL